MAAKKQKEEVTLKNQNDLKERLADLGFDIPEKVSELWDEAGCYLAEGAGIRQKILQNLINKCYPDIPVVDSDKNIAEPPKSLRLKLSEDQIAWLSDFSEYYYGGNPHKCTLIKLSDEDRKESWRRNNKAEVDAMNQVLIPYDDIV